MSTFPVTRSKKVASEKEVKKEPDFRIKKYFDGRKWRRLCVVNRCGRTVQAKGFCARHLKEIIGDSSTPNPESLYDSDSMDDDDSRSETTEVEQSIFTSSKKIKITQQVKQNIVPKPTEAISVSSTNNVRSTTQTSACASTITIMPADEHNKNIFQIEDISSDSTSDTPSNAIVNNVSKENNTTKLNKCHYQLPTNNGLHCRSSATYKCAHCLILYCLQHGLQHQEDLKDEIRSLLSKAQGLFNNVQRLNIIDGKTSCTMLLNQWAATMHAKIDQTRNELQIKLDQCDKKIEEEKDQWRTYLGNHLEQNVGCILTEQLQKYEIDGSKVEKARQEFVRLQKLFHSLNNQQLVKMIDNGKNHMSLNLPVIVCSNIVFEGLDSMGYSQDNINQSDQQGIELNDNPTCEMSAVVRSRRSTVTETKDTPNVVVTPTETDMIKTVNENRASVPKESNIETIQDLPPIIAFNYFVDDLQDDTNNGFTQEETDIIRTIFENKTKRTKKTNTKIKNNIPSTITSNLTAREIKDNPDVVVTSTESGAIRTVNNKRAKITKEPDTESIQYIPAASSSTPQYTPAASSSMPQYIPAASSSTPQNIFEDNIFNFEFPTVVLEEGIFHGTNESQETTTLPASEPTTMTSMCPNPNFNFGKNSEDKQDDYKLDLSSHELTDEDMPVVVRYALKNNELTQPFIMLDLSCNQIGAEGIGELAHALKTNKTLITLSLHTNEIDNLGIEYLSKALEKNKGLTDVDVSQNQIGSFGIRYLSNALEFNKTLTILNLDHNIVGAKGAQFLGSALQINNTLKVLKLSWCNIEDSGAQYICEALHTNTSLTTLEIASNRIEETGALSLRNALKKNTSLTTLNLRCNLIGETGAFYVSDALRKNKTLVNLSLERNTIRDTGVNHICAVLQENTTLTTLNLAGNQIGKLGAEHLSDALRVNKTLTHLDLSYNGIRSTGARLMSTAIRANKALIVLNLQHNHIGEIGIRSLSGAIQDNQTLTILDLDGNTVTLGEKLHLEDRLKENKNGDKH